LAHSSSASARTNLRAVEALPRIEELLDVPVVTSNQAALEAVLGRPAAVA
jgi:maleate cis-trans isomerase